MTRHEFVISSVMAVSFRILGGYFNCFNLCILLYLCACSCDSLGLGLAALRQILSALSSLCRAFSALSRVCGQPYAFRRRFRPSERLVSWDVGLATVLGLTSGGGIGLPGLPWRLVCRSSVGSVNAAAAGTIVVATKGAGFGITEARCLLGATGLPALADGLPRNSSRPYGSSLLSKSSAIVLVLVSSNVRSSCSPIVSICLTSARGGAVLPVLAGASIGASICVPLGVTMSVAACARMKTLDHTNSAYEALHTLNFVYILHLGWL